MGYNYNSVADNMGQSSFV